MANVSNMNLGNATNLKNGFLDLAAALFVIGGVISLIASILVIPLSNIYPVVLTGNVGMTVLVVLVAGVVCSLGSIHCYSLAMRRQLSHAGFRGIVFGAILLALSLGVIGAAGDIHAEIAAVSSILVLVAGTICYVLRG